MKGIIISHPRFGSTFLCELLNSVEDTKCYFEIFHHHSKAVENGFRDDTKKMLDVLNCNNVEEVKLALRRRPEKCVDQLQKISQKKNIFFKVFPGHVNDDTLRRLIAHSDNCIFLKRNVLNAYCSNIIANQSSKWQDLNTSESKVFFYRKKFLWFIHGVLKFYDKCEKICNDLGVSYSYVDYELLSINGAVNADYIKNKFNLELQSTTTKIKKQDKRDVPIEKLFNSESAMRFLKKLELKELNDSKPSDLASLETAVQYKLTLIDRLLDLKTEAFK
jgi:hypothetical protein